MASPLTAPRPPRRVLYCPQCGYDLRGQQEMRCPECGFRYDEEAIRDVGHDWYLRSLAALERSVKGQAIVTAAFLVTCAIALFTPRAASRSAWLLIWLATFVAVAWMIQVWLLRFYGSMSFEFLPPAGAIAATALVLMGLVFAGLAGGKVVRLLLTAAALAQSVFCQWDIREGRQKNLHQMLLPASRAYLTRWRCVDWALNGLMVALLAVSMVLVK
ncbi:MAG: hypothetical protein HUU22_01545 [Phycisphaerae bacterium]|nr:transposase [Phycisphaerae bacterium]NUQ44700.1 hypothetical protein [Phycisphaerae bacterium]